MSTNFCGWNRKRYPATLLDRIAKNKYKIKVLSNIQVRIQSKTSIKYILTVKELQAKHFHTK